MSTLKQLLFEGVPCGDAEMSTLKQLLFKGVPCGDAEMSTLKQPLSKGVPCGDADMHTQKEPLLVSACLLGEPVRYDGQDHRASHVAALSKHYHLVPFCPEVAGGLSVPRTPCEQREGRVYNRNGEDVTAAFHKGAQDTLALCQRKGIVKAVLKSRSPSCGKDAIYDGTFQGRLVSGQGVAAGLLREEGISLYDETDCKELMK